MTIHFERVVGFDPNGIRRIYASTWVEARQEARNYIRKRPDTAPLSAWRFDTFADIPAGTMSARSTDLNRILSNDGAPDRMTINRLWDVLDEPEFNRALGSQQNMKKPPAR